MAKPWIVRHRDGWCALPPGAKPDPKAWNDPTLCGHVVNLRSDSGNGKPDCPDCLAKLAELEATPVSEQLSAGSSGPAALAEHHFRNWDDERLTDLRTKVQQARDDYYEQAIGHGELGDHDEQEARAYGRVEMCDEVLGWLAAEEKR